MAELPSYPVECETCGTVYDGVWSDDSIDPQDIAEPPVAEQTCPNGHKQTETYPGWTYNSEAG